MTGGRVVEVNLENERFSVLFEFKLSRRKFHVGIWQITQTIVPHVPHVPHVQQEYFS